MDIEKITEGVYRVDGKIATVNSVPGTKVYGEKLKKADGEEYRLWSPYRSKPSAAFMKGLKKFPIKEGSKVLYLGVGDGTTASHLSDIVKESGLIIGVDIAEKAFEKFMGLCDQRENLIPVLADANKPGEYSEYVPGEVDVVYQDIAQKEQAEILMKNLDKYLKDGGRFVYMVKSRSIDVSKAPSKIFKEERKKLEDRGFKIDLVKKLGPFEKDHAMIMGRKINK